MRKIFFVLGLCLLVLASCSMAKTTRKIAVSIPDHPWEAASGKRLWYTLKWTSGNEIRTIYVSENEREIELDVPVGETVLICAFPLGDMAPFGGALTPLMDSPRLTLSQNEGSLVADLMDIDASVTRRLNYGRLKTEALSKVEDFRLLDSLVLLRDLQNGELDSGSIRKKEMFGVDEFVLPNGIWISEYLTDPAFVVSENIAASTQLPEGVFRYLNSEMDRVLMVVVDSKGDFYSYLKQSLV